MFVIVFVDPHGPESAVGRLSEVAAGFAGVAVLGADVPVDAVMARWFDLVGDLDFYVVTLFGVPPVLVMLAWRPLRNAERLVLSTVASHEARTCSSIGESVVTGWVVSGHDVGIERSELFF